MSASLIDSAEIRAMLLVEGSLARVQGTLGLIPETAAAFIDRSAREVQIDPAALAAETAVNGVPVPALVECAAHAGADLHLALALAAGDLEADHRLAIEHGGGARLGHGVGDGGHVLQLDPAALPPSPGPLMIDAERQLELLAPLPLEGTAMDAAADGGNSDMCGGIAPGGNGDSEADADCGGRGGGGTPAPAGCCR